MAIVCTSLNNYDHMSVMLISVVQDDELHRACDVGNLLLVQCLVKQGANVNSKSVLVSILCVKFILCACQHTQLHYRRTRFTVMNLMHCVS